MSKYVILMTDGKLSAPVALDVWLEINDDDTGRHAMIEWLHGRAYVTGGGAAPQQVSWLVDLPL